MGRPHRAHRAPRSRRTCWSTCAARGTTWTATSPSPSTSRSSRDWPGSASGTSTASSPGRTAWPAAYLSRRRIERAQDLLRATTLSVTEVCHAVGFSSLGSFSSRFHDVVGETPREFQQRWGASAPRIPGCFVLMAGLVETSASQEKPPESGAG